MHVAQCFPENAGCFPGTSLKGPRPVLRGPGVHQWQPGGGLWPCRSELLLVGFQMKSLGTTLEEMGGELGKGQPGLFCCWLPTEDLQELFRSLWGTQLDSSP